LCGRTDVGAGSRSVEPRRRLRRPPKENREQEQEQEREFFETRAGMRRPLVAGAALPNASGKSASPFLFLFLSPVLFSLLRD
jgi:hypothetical protein